jgi:hypothetical protein
MPAPSPSRLLLIALFLALAARAQQNTGGLDVAVRSGIDQAEKDRRDHDPAYGADSAKRRRLFFLARVQEEKNDERLAQPVDAAALAKELTRQLEAHGFRRVQPGQKPEIIITVKYGRGFLSNPYSDLDGDKFITSLSDSDVLVAHHLLTGGRLEERHQWAAQPKLIIQVRAWAYPPPADPKQKIPLLWVTTMHVDDPDHRDLNEIAPQLLATGAAFFDRPIAREREVVINRPLREGQVKVGTPEVVADPKAK